MKLLLLLILCGRGAADPPAPSLPALDPAAPSLPAAPARCPAALSFVSVAFLSGSTMELPCRCKPESALRGVTWFYYRELPGRVPSRPVVLSDGADTRVLERNTTDGQPSRRFSILLFNLVIVDTRPSDSGHYICGSSEGDFYFAYEVVVQLTENARLVLLDRGETPRPHNTVRGVNHQVTLFTAWSGWTACDRCGGPGEMINAGLCMVSHSASRKHAPGAPRYWSETAGGPVACGSPAAPRFALLAARARTPEIMVRGCRHACPTTGSAVQDAQALLRELLGRGPAGVATTETHVTLATHVQLSCPGASPLGAVGWDRDGQPLLRSEFARSRGRKLEVTEFGRISTDNNNRLHILNARRRDAGRYACWVAGRVAAQTEVRLAPRNVTARRVTGRDPAVRWALAAVWRLYAGLGIAAGGALLVRLRGAIARDAGSSRV